MPNSRASVERQIQGDVKKILEYHERNQQAALEQAATLDNDKGDGASGA